MQPPAIATAKLARQRVATAVPYLRHQESTFKFNQLLAMVLE
jgi:hypothetical protein